jgi:hypothetical protein
MEMGVTNVVVQVILQLGACSTCRNISRTILCNTIPHPLLQAHRSNVAQSDTSDNPPFTHVAASASTHHPNSGSHVFSDTSPPSSPVDLTSLSPILL